jgi:hypothetical protein
METKINYQTLCDDEIIYKIKKSSDKRGKHSFTVAVQKLQLSNN